MAAPSSYPYQMLGEAYELKGDLTASLSVLLEARKIENYPWLSGALGRVFAKLGRAEEARRILAELDSTSQVSYVSPYAVASVHAHLGEIDRAFELLERGYEERCEDLGFLEIDPRLDVLHGDPRFGDLVRRVGFVH